MHMPAVHLEWGREGLQQALERADVIAIVDVLSFSTTVCAAIEAGASVLPLRWEDDEEAVAASEGVVARESVGGRRALSPLGFDESSAGKCYAIRSPNGATLSARAQAAPVCFAGCLRNASATSQALQSASQEHEAGISVIAAGERWPSVSGESQGGAMRVALEDWLGASALISALVGEFSADARIAKRVFDASHKELEQLVCECPSGVELIERGFRDEVLFACDYDAAMDAVVLRAGRYERW